MTLLSLSHRHAVREHCSVCGTWPPPGRKVAKLVLRGATVQLTTAAGNHSACPIDLAICRPCALAIADASQPSKQRRSR